MDTNKYETATIITDGMMEREKVIPRPAKDGEEEKCAKQLAIWNYTIQPGNQTEQEIAARLDKEEMLAEKTRVKRSKKSADTN